MNYESIVNKVKELSEKGIMKYNEYGYPEKINLLEFSKEINNKNGDELRLLWEAFSFALTDKYETEVYIFDDNDNDNYYL